MACSSIKNCERIQRIASLLHRYQHIQSSLHSQDVDPESDDSVESAHAEIMDVVPMTDTLHDDIFEITETVEIVQSQESNGEHQIIHDHVVDDIQKDLLQYERAEMLEEMNNFENVNQNNNDANLHEEDPETMQSPTNDDIHSFLDELQSTQLLNDYNVIIMEYGMDELYSVLLQITNDHHHFHCDMDQCDAMRRNHRCRHQEPVLFHGKESSYSMSELVMIDIMDSIHCHLLHSFDIGYRLQHQKNQTKSPKFSLQSLRKYALQKRKKLIQLRNMERVRNNKFRTASNSCLNTTGLITNGLNQLTVSEEKTESDLNELNVSSSPRSEMSGDNIYRFGRDLSSIPMTSKYEHLKEELLNNAIYRMDISAYTHLIVKSQMKMSCDIARSLTSNEAGPMLIDNVAVLVLYCDYDALQCRYTEILEDCVLSSQNVEELFNFHFGLENTVRIFGSNFSEKSQFQSQRHSSTGQHPMTSFYLYCPSRAVLNGIKCQFLTVTSMTTNLETVALYNVDPEDADGMIVEFGPSHDRMSRLNVSYFTCSWISSFGAEDEQIFIVNEGTLELQNAILSTPNPEGQGMEYKEMRVFLEALSCFDGLFQAQDAWKSTSATKQHFEIIHRLIEYRDDVNHKTNASESTGCDPFELQIFEAFCSRKEQIEILVQNLRGPFCQFLFENGSIEHFIRFDRICRVFPHCQLIRVWYMAMPQYNTPSGINGEFLGHLCLTMLDALNKCTQSALQRIVIYNNHHRVAPVITGNQIGSVAHRFVERGWQIQLHSASELMDEIVITRILIWKEIEVTGFIMEDGMYNIETNVVNGVIKMEYTAIREMFEEINAKLTEKGMGKADINEMKKVFPSKHALFKKGSDLMAQRQEKLNLYFQTLLRLAFGNSDDGDGNDTGASIRMAIMILLTQHLMK